MAILAWWAGKAGEVFRDQNKLTKLAGLWAGYRAPETAKRDPAYLLVFVLILLSVGISFTTENFRLGYVPILTLFLVTSAWSCYRDEVAVSNRTFVVLLVFAIVSYTYGYGLSVRTVYLDFYDVLILSAAPLIIGKLDLTRLANSRLAAFGFLVAVTLPDLYLRGSFVPVTHVVSVGVGGHALPLVSWVLTIAAFELAARVLHWIACHQGLSGRAPA